MSKVNTDGSRYSVSRDEAENSDFSNKNDMNTILCCHCDNRRIGQSSSGIGIGDGSVVTKMEKKKPVKLTLRYIPSGTEYTAQQEADFVVKEQQLINYVIEHLLHQKALEK